jgi:hypothetical protein
MFIAYTSCDALHEYRSTQLQRTSAITDTLSTLLLRYNEGLL